MAGPGSNPSPANTSPAGEATKARILQATLTTLTNSGIVGASARAISRTGDFNQALIFYHFGSVENAIVEAVSEMGSKRVERHRAALEEASSLADVVGVARQLHEDDTTSENMTVLVQAFAGARGNQEMGQKLYEALEPWSELLAETIDRVLANSSITQVLPSQTIANVMRSLFLGIELLDDLDSTKGHAEQMLASMEALAEIIEPFLPSNS